METPSHLRLKQLAVAFLRERGCRIVATEVRCPISRYRVDVAGYFDRPPLPDGTEASAWRDRPPARPRRADPWTVLVECKRSRTDFMRDRSDREKLLRRRDGLERLRRALEEGRLRKEEPELRLAGSSLFPELDEWEFHRARHPAYRDLLRRLRRVDQMLHGQTKFCLAARYALADRLYLAAPRGMIRPRELPPGWGLLECSSRVLRGGDPNADLFGDSALTVVVRAEPRPAPPKHRERLLRNIAAAASATVSKSLGVQA